MDLDSRILTDEHLALRAQTGDVRAYDELVKRYWSRLRGYAHRLHPRSTDIEDILQDAFLKAYVNLRSYRPSRHFSPWIYRIVRNTLYDHVRSRRRDPLPFFDPDVLFPHPIARERPDTDAERNEIRAQIDAQLEQLDPKYREPLVLRYIDGMSYTDIAEILRLPVGTVGVRITRALKLLRRQQPSSAI